MQSLKLAFVQAVSTPIAQILLSIALAILFWFVGPEILVGFTPGSLVAFVAAATQLGKPIRTLTNVQSVIQRGLAVSKIGSPRSIRRQSVTLGSGAGACP